MFRTTFLPYSMHLLCRRGDAQSVTFARRYSDVFGILRIGYRRGGERTKDVPDAVEMQCSYHSVGVS
jgi:hypothetical protein